MENTNYRILLGKYSNPLIGPVHITLEKDKLKLEFADQSTASFYPVSNNEFELVEEDDVKITFNEKMEMSLYENGFWSFTAWKDEEGY